MSWISVIISVCGSGVVGARNVISGAAWGGGVAPGVITGVPDDVGVFIAGARTPLGRAGRFFVWASVAGWAPIATGVDAMVVAFGASDSDGAVGAFCAMVV